MQISAHFCVATMGWGGCGKDMGRRQKCIQDWGNAVDRVWGAGAAAGGYRRSLRRVTWHRAPGGETHVEGDGGCGKWH